jgi:WD40 repeat protein
MPRFTLSQLLMGVAFVAIVLGFTHTEGCGRRFSMIESLSFSSDDSAIAVAKLSARDAQTPWKLYIADVSRTISWLDAATGKSRGQIHQDFRPGNCGPAFALWRVGRTSALCNPSNDQVAMSAFGGGDITRNAGTSEPTVVSLQHPACNIAFSKSGRFLAASGGEQVTVLDTLSDTVVMRIQARDLPFLGASLMSFTNDDSPIALGGDSGVHIWEIATSTQRSTVGYKQ